MAGTWRNKVAQTDVPFRFTLTEAGRPFDLTGYTVEVLFYSSAGTLLQTRSCPVITAGAGLVSYSAWQAADPIHTVGEYAATFRATKTATGLPRTFPNTGRIPISIEA